MNKAEAIKSCLSILASIIAIGGLGSYILSSIYTLTHLNFYEVYVLPYNVSFKKKITFCSIVYLLSTSLFILSIIPNHNLKYIFNNSCLIVVIMFILTSIIIYLFKGLFPTYGMIEVELHKDKKNIIPNFFKKTNSLFNPFEENTPLFFLNMLSENRMSVSNKINDGIPDRTIFINLSNIDWYEFKINDKYKDKSTKFIICNAFKNDKTEKFLWKKFITYIILISVFIGLFLWLFNIIKTA